MSSRRSAAGPKVVALPSGITVERRGVWLYESCPDHETRHYRDPLTGANVPHDMSTNGRSPTMRQAICPTCGLWALWVPIVKRGKRGPYKPRTTPR